jgi:hypothetical protein
MWEIPLVCFVSATFHFDIFLSTADFKRTMETLTLIKLKRAVGIVTIKNAVEWVCSTCTVLLVCVNEYV